jgi:hypothetical protein
MLWPQNFKKYNLLCWYEGDFCFGGEGGLVVCRWGELGLGRRRRNRGGEAKLTYINFFQRFHWWKLHRWLRRWFWRKNQHITVWICHFKSLRESVGNLNGEPVTSLYGLLFWISRWFRRKTLPAKTSTSATRLFF